MQVFKICIVFLLIAAVIIEAADIREKGRYKIFKRKPFAEKHEDAKESGRMTQDVMNKMIMMFGKKPAPVYVMMMPMQSDLSYTGGDSFGNEDLGMTGDGSSDSPLDAASDGPSDSASDNPPDSASDNPSDAASDSPADNPPPDNSNGARESNWLHKKSPSALELGNDALEDDDRIIFQIDDGSSADEDENDDDEDESDSYDDSIEDQSDNHNENSEIQQIPSQEQEEADLEAQIIKNKDCGQSNDSSFSMERASRRQNEVNRQTHKKRSKLSPRQNQMKRKNATKRDRQTRRRKEQKRRNRKRQQKIRRRKQLQKKRNRRRRLQAQRRRQQANRVVYYRIQS